MGIQQISYRVQSLYNPNIRSAEWIEQFCYLKNISGDFKVGLLGDSHIERLGQHPQLINLGMGGDKINNVRWRVNNGIFNNKTISDLYVCCGVNDLFAGDSPEVVTKSYLALLDDLIQIPSVYYIHVIAIPLVNPVATSFKDMNDKIQTVNRLLKDTWYDPIEIKVNGWINDNLHLDDHTNAQFMDYLNTR